MATVSFSGETHDEIVAQIRAWLDSAEAGDNDMAAMITQQAEITKDALRIIAQSAPGPIAESDVVKSLTKMGYKATDATRDAVPALATHGHFRRAYADLLTDALRVEVLEAAGYEVVVLEFVSTEHSAKNTLLRAHRRPNAPRPSPELFAPLHARAQELGVSLSLLRQLRAAVG